MAATNKTSPTEPLVSGPDNGSLVLIVDDIADLRAMVAKFLHEAGYQTIEATNGKQALALAESYKPDLIVTDWMMPEMSGPDLIEAIKGNPELSSVPMVLLTAKSDEESKFSSTQIGADSFLGKPFLSLIHI